MTKTLDEAVWRRFDDAIEVPKPTKSEIEGILRQTLSSVAIGSINWQATIQSLENLFAAQIVQIAHLKFLKSGTTISGKSPRPSNHCVEDEDWAIDEVKRWALGLNGSE